MGISPRLATGLDVSCCWDRHKTEYDIPKIFLAFMTDELARRRSCTVFWVCVSTPSSMASSVEPEAFILLRASMSDMVGGRCLGELLCDGSCFPELGYGELSGWRGVCGMQEVEE
jgi:hypothetical protein